MSQERRKKLKGKNTLRIVILMQEFSRENSREKKKAREAQIKHSDLVKRKQEASGYKICSRKVRINTSKI
jgi:hypothetical protein